MIQRMRHRTTRLVLLAGFGLGLAATAQAQGTGAPAGMEPATTPGGTEGRAGMRNEAEAIRDGNAVPVPPRGGVPVETAPAAPPPPAAPRP